MAEGGVPWHVYGSLVMRSWPPVLLLALAALTFSPLVSLLANLLLVQCARAASVSGMCH